MKERKDQEEERPGREDKRRRAKCFLKKEGANSQSACQPNKNCVKVIAVAAVEHLNKKASPEDFFSGARTVASRNQGATSGKRGPKEEPRRRLRGPLGG